MTIAVRADTGWNPDWATHPGEHLAEYIEARGLTQADFARLTNMSPKLVSTILNGKNPVTAETAIRFERVLGVKAYIWTSLQAKWDLHLARQNEKTRFDTQGWLARFPIKELQLRGKLPVTTDQGILIDALLSILGIGTPAAYEKKVCSLAVHHRQSRAHESSRDHVFTWLLLGEAKARTMNLPAFDLKIFLRGIKEIRKLTIAPPATFERRMKALCRMAGVALIFEKPLSKTCLFGSARWFDADRAIIQMSLRMKTNDHFWWTFFHEAGHIALHRGRNFLDDKGGEGGHVENEADEWANERLFGPGGVAHLVAKRPRSEVEVRATAERLGLHPGIVVGALQHHGLLPYKHLNWLKERFDWAEVD